MTHHQVHTARMVCAVLGMTGCARGTTSALEDPAPMAEVADAATDSDAFSYSPPSSLPGWEKPFDGITCRHPAVQADCQDGWCRIPSGCFIKGSPADELGRGPKGEDQRAVTLTHDVWIQQYEVTQEQWTAQGLPNPSGLTPAGTEGDCTDNPRCPVGNITWFEAVAFANLLSKTHTPPLANCYELNECTGSVGRGMVCGSISITAPTLYECEGYRLLTDAEYEYAVRAGTTTAFYSGPITTEAAAEATQCIGYGPLLETAWYCANAARLTHPVGQKRPNSWHLYDMTGNALEWVHDEEKGATGSPGPWTDPGGNMTAYMYRQTRGASAVSWPSLLRSSSRVLGFTWGFHAATIGFRLARTILHGGSSATK